MQNMVEYSRSPTMQWKMSENTMGEHSRAHFKDTPHITPAELPDGDELPVVRLPLQVHGDQH